MVRMKCHGRVMLVCVFAVLIGFADEPTVTEVTAKQRYPWNGLVDITCKVTGINGMVNGVKFTMAAVMPDTGVAHDVSRFWVVEGSVRSTDHSVHTNGNYHLLWDAQADLGEVFYDNIIVRVIVAYAGVQLWEGGPYWAEMNVGAERSEDYGYYFWWGDTVGYIRNSSNDGWESVKDDSSYLSVSESRQTYDKSVSTLRSEGYIDSFDNLVAKYDAATIHFGSPWRMPTWAEFSDLISNCTITWTNRNGVCGRLVTGRGDYSDRSIFFPAAGTGYSSSLDSVGSYGTYWSSTPCSEEPSRTWGFGFDSKGVRRYNNLRYTLRSVRPVRGFAE